MSRRACTTQGAHCQLCGTTDTEDLTTGDQGYTACCNEPVEFGPCDRSHATW